MEDMRREAIDVFNEQVDNIKTQSKEMDTRVSLITFSSSADNPTLWNRPVSQLRKIDFSDYKPRGMTAMLDTVGYIIKRLNKLDSGHKNEAFLVIIISDGYENK